MTPDQWAISQMAARYGHTLLPSDGVGHIATLCYEYLKEEHKVIRGWFQDDNKFSELLSSRFLNIYFNRPLGDGIGWDFKMSGEPEHLMVSFKAQLIAAQRALESIPVQEFNTGNPIIGGIRTMIRAAYTSRAKMHSWKPKSVIKGKEYFSQDLSYRWVSVRTFVFLVKGGVDPIWAWECSKCEGSFGPFDEERSQNEKLAFDSGAGADLRSAS